MVARVTQVVGSLLALALVVAALWSWREANDIAGNAARPDLALWAVRSGALAAVAGAQVLIVTFAVGAIYRRRAFDEAVRLLAGVVCTVALVGAVALGLAGR
jgi:hypothetical protein